MPAKAKLSLDDLRIILARNITDARAKGDFRTVADSVSELRQIELAQARLVPETGDRSAALKLFTDAEIRGEFERRDLGDVLTVVWTPLPTREE